MTIRVVIVDDQHLVRAGFAAILSARDDIEVVGEAADGAEAVAVTEATSPDVVLMDLRMPGTDGVAATAQLVTLADPPRVLVLTTYDTDDDVFRALRAGATGFLLKDVHRDELVEAVRSVARGDSLLSPTVTRRLIEARPVAAGHGAQQRTPSRRAVTTGRTRSCGWCGRPVERRDRRPAGDRRDDRQDARREHPDQARPPQPGAGGRHGVRARSGQPRAGGAVSPAGDEHDVVVVGGRIGGSLDCGLPRCSRLDRPRARVPQLPVGHHVDPLLPRRRAGPRAGRRRCPRRGPRYRVHRRSATSCSSSTTRPRRPSNRRRSRVRPDSACPSGARRWTRSWPVGLRPHQVSPSARTPRLSASCTTRVA